MYGYIYLTTNLINNRMYIGKHKSNSYDSSYYGSGKILLQAIEKYGIENFKNEVLFIADNEEILNIKEIEYINAYRNKYGKLLYNIAKGGNGGDTFSYKSEKEKNEFINKITDINRKRCQTEEFKSSTSKRMRDKYLDLNERKKQSDKIKASWSDEKLKMKQRERLKEYYKFNKKDQSYLYKKCILKLNDILLEFESVKSLKEYLKEEFNYKVGNNEFKRIVENSNKGIPFKPFHKNKLKRLCGMMIFYKQNENVETMGDECSPVGDEIGTSPKCKTEIEEIVHAI